VKTLFLLLCVAANLFGAGHEGGSSTDELLWKIVNFAILAGGLGYLIGKHAPAFFRNRSQAIQKSIQEAAAIKAQAEARAAEIERRIGQLDVEISSLRQAAALEMQREAERIRADTSLAIEKLRKQAEQEVASAAKAARMELKTFFARLTVQQAAQEVQKRMTPDLQARLVDRFAAEIESGRTRPEVH